MLNCAQASLLAHGRHGRIQFADRRSGDEHAGDGIMNSSFINDLDATAPCRTVGHRVDARPSPRFRRFTYAELHQGLVVGPGDAEVLGLARIGEFDIAFVQQ